jgi:uncharacterized protein with von Willebrand factor type A (vWA) domain
VSAATARPARGELLAFVHVLRSTGVTVSPDQVLAHLDAVAAVAPSDLRDLYLTGRVTLVSDPRDLPTYDAAFRAFHLGGPGVRMTVSGQVPRPTARDEPPPGTPMRDDADEEDAGATGRLASDAESLRHRRFDQASEDELVALRALMARIPVAIPRRRSRRTVPAGRGPRLDVRRSVRAAARTDGELVHRAWRRRRTRPRPVVLVLDVSGSMAGFSRALLLFASVTRRRAGRVEVFCFGTRLTRVTDELADRDVDRALAAAADHVVDWDGGTRIGESIATLLREHGPRGRLRGAVVVVCSDGLERGDPADLDRAMARLHRHAHAVVWVNPLRADPRFEPVQRGMRAALPHVDRLVSGHDLASLEDLAAVVAALR